MALLQTLTDFLRSHGSPPSPSPSPPPPQSLSDPSLQQALCRLAGLVARLPSQLQQADAGTQEGERIGQEIAAPDASSSGARSWTASQVEFVFSLTQATIAHFRHAPLELGLTESLEGVFRSAIDACIRALKNLTVSRKAENGFSAWDEQVHNRLLSLLELLLDEGKTTSDMPSLNLSNEEMQELDKLSPINISFQEFRQTNVSKSFGNGRQETEIFDDIVQLLRSNRPLKLEMYDFDKPLTDSSNMLSASQLFAVAQANIHKELLDVCGSCVANVDFQTGEERQNLLPERLALVSRMLRLLCLLSNVASGLPHTEDIISRLVALTAWMPQLFRQEILFTSEEMNSHCCFATFISSVIAFVDVAGLGDCFTQNLRLFVAASAVDVLMSTRSKSGKGSSSQKLPAVLEPQVVSYICGLIRTLHAQSWHSNAINHSGKQWCPWLPSKAPVLNLRSQPFDLLLERSHSDRMQILFPDGELWLSGLLNAVAQLYSLGAEASSAGERAILHGKEIDAGSLGEAAVASCEDEALFGNLFSESSKQPSISDSSSQSNLENRSCIFHDTALQAVIDVLTFLKDCIFGLGCQTTSPQELQIQMNAEGIDLLLGIFFHSVNEKADGQCSTDMISKLSKSSFDVINSILSSGLLSAQLEQQFLSRILEKGYRVCTMSSNTTAILINLVIHHSSIQDAKRHDSLTLAVWKSFRERVESASHKSELMDLPVAGAAAYLPSVFFVELLLMAFHSSSTTARLSILKDTKSLLRNLATAIENVDVTCLAPCSLLFSQVVMLFKYMSLHFKAFSSWLIKDLKSNLSRALEEHSPRNSALTAVGFSLPSMAATVGQALRDAAPVCRDTGISDTFLARLYDINVYSKGDGDLMEIFDSIGGVASVNSSIVDVLERWRGRKITEVEELLVERHTFYVGWSTVCSVTKATQCCTCFEPDGINGAVSGADLFLRFTENLLSHFSQDQNKGSDESLADWQVFFTRVVSHFGALRERNAKDFSIDRLRQDSMLSLILSFLQKGFEVSNSDTIQDLWEEELVKLCKHIALSYADDLSLGGLVKTLSSALSVSTDSFHYGVLDIVTGDQTCDVSSSVLLVLQGGLSWSKQDQLFTKLGVSFSPLHTLLRRGMPISWFTEILAKVKASGNFTPFDKIFLPSLLQIHPCSYHPASAVVMSCMWVIDLTLDTLKSFLKLGRISRHDVVFEGLVEVLMAVKLEEIFESVHTKCDEVLCILFPSKEERLQVCDFHVIKQKDVLLKALSSCKEISDSIREELILHVVDIFTVIHTDPARCDVLRGYFTSSGGSLSSFVDVLDNCYQETVNLKVLQFLTSVVSVETVKRGDLQSALQEKLVYTDRKALSWWLEQRLLGSSTKAADGNLAMSLSTSGVRDTLVAFLNALVSSESSFEGKELRTHLLNSLLLSLDQAFNFPDGGGRRSYFLLLLQLANSEPHIRCVLLSSIQLIKTLPGQKINMEGLQALMTFLISLLNSVVSQRGQLLGKLGEKKSLHASAVGLSHSTNKNRLPAPKKTLEIAQTVTEKSGLGPDCDAVSMDDDEDDGTSDGEITSLEKDEEDDVSNSEKALASRVCTFTSSGNNFMEQHWYFCYTCDLTVSKGCCSVCAKVCHRGHKVVYSRLSRFFCDCGAGGVRGQSCLCLKPRKYVSSAPVVVPSDQEPSPSESDSDLEDDMWIDNETLCQTPIIEGEETKLLSVFSDLDIEGHVLALCDRILNSFNSIKCLLPSVQNEISLGDDKKLSLKGDFTQLKRSYKGGSFDMKIKAEYVSAKELKLHLANGTLFKSVLSTNGRGKLAVGEGDKVSIFDVEQIIGPPSSTPVTLDKTTVKPLSKNSVRFELVHLVFNRANESYLAVAGYDDCQIFTVNSRGEVTDRLAVELALHDSHISRLLWVPGSQVQLMVVTSRFVKIYDLSQDNISPVHYCTILEDHIVDAALIPLGHGQFILVVLSYSGLVYRCVIAADAEPGARILTETILIPDRVQVNKAVSLHYSSALKLLFLSFSEGLSLVGRLDTKATCLLEVSCLLEVDQDDKPSAAGLHHWIELFDGCQGWLVALNNQRSNSAVAVSFGPAEIEAQYLRPSGSLGFPRVDGIAVYKSPLKSKHDILILHEDGSLQVFVVGQLNESAGDVVRTSTLEPDQVKKLGDAILGSRSSSLSAPVFPLDFFEKTTCITNDIRLGGDGLRNLDSEGAKTSLASDDGFLEGPSPSGFKISVYNSNPDIVMVGCRVHVGNSSTGHIPSELRIFQRAVKLEEGMHCWYDLPFTNAEALLADEEFTLTVGSTFGGFSLPRIDNLEVYGRPKDDFGWKEKLEAVLDMETKASVPGSLGRRGKLKVSKSSSLEEQIVADCFRFLFVYYTTIRTKPTFELNGPNMASRWKCNPLLELVFESDRQPYLQAAARRVVHALYPVKDAFYLAKDTLRLTGVSRVCPVLASRMCLGGATLSLVVQEFTAQLRAVCKIALHRKSNFALFLENNGPSVIVDLMKILSELLVLEQPDAEVVNSLVVPSVDIIYGYAECLAFRTNNGLGTPMSVAPALTLFKTLLFAPHEIVRASCSLAMSSRLLQVPFPKQTILPQDDATENLRSTLPSESGTGTGGLDGQVMMEEDGGNASVQYCCDGCSTVPILGRRWHCNICPDFDLCEACYEVMDGDRLPPPHSREHSMSAIPIDNDIAVSGEAADIRFASIEDLSDENLLQVATALSMQTDSLPLGLQSDVGISGNDTLSTAVDTRGITISASKRAFNSLLLKSLIDESQGWMKQTSGAQALPLMQFFYRLASACTGPFVETSGTDSINLETFVRLLLEELNLNDPISIKTRSNFGEVVVLLFTFFNLMLRNWHQPGSDHSLPKPAAKGGEVVQAMPSSSGTGSPSSDEGQVKAESGSQLDRACAALRQQQLINYLFSIIQQLGQIFKSSARNVEAGPVTSTGAVCGALLTVKKEFAAGNFAPFFTDSYAKAHRNDLFGEFHRLLLESTFRLAYNLVRPEKSCDKDQVGAKVLGAADLKLDGWQEVLCAFINNPHTTSIRRFARRLLLHLCGSKGQYYNVRDAWQLSREVRKLFKLVQKSGGFHSLLVYERSVKLFKCLSAIVEVANARPKNWQKYCLRHPDLLQFLLSGIFSFGEESVVQTLKLLTLAFYAGKESGLFSASKGETADLAGTVTESGIKQSNDLRKKKKRGSIEDGTDAGAEKTFLDMELSVEQLAAEDGSLLLHIIDAFLLEWNASCVRVEAKAVLMGSWHHAKAPVRELLLKKLLHKIPTLPSYGQNIAEYTDLLTWILGKGIQGPGTSSHEYAVVCSCLTNNAVKVLFDTLCSQNELLANHPNSRIYNTLSSLVDFDGYYLESEPCLACSCPEVPYTRMKLESLKSETKFTDNRILVKCVGSHTIQSVTMNVHDARRSKSVKVLNLYYNNRPVTDLSELKNNWSLWKRAKSCYLAFNQTELKVEFAIPITACNFMIELDAFYENLQASSLESLQCPRCSRYVTDKHGICGNCHENAYQCRQCRNINYENLDSFLCNECGYSKYGRFEFNFMAKPSFHFESMENDEDMKKGLAAIEVESENAHKRYQQLLGFKKPLLKLVSSIGETETDSQQKDSVQQMIVSLPGSSSFKINRKIAILGVLYGEKCKMAFDSVSRSVQNLQGLRRVLSSFLEQKRCLGTEPAASRLSPTRPLNHCYGCANTFVGHCLEWLQVLAKMPHCRQQLVSAGILSELFENNIHQGSKMARAQARSVLCGFTEGDSAAVGQLNNLIKQKAIYCLDHHRSIDIATCVREELSLLSEACALVDEFWESRLRVVFQLLFTSIQVGARHPVISEHIILPCLRIISQACTPPKAETSSAETEKPSSAQRSETRHDEIDNVVSTVDHVNTPPAVKTQSNSLEKDSDRDSRGYDAPLVSYVEWKNGAAYVDFVRRQYIATQGAIHGARPATVKTKRDPKRADFLGLKYLLRWKRRACKGSLKNEFAAFEESSWVCELVLSACSQAIRVEMCGLLEVLCSQSASRRSKFLNLLMDLLPATRSAGESASDYFELLHKMIDTEDARLFLTVRGFLKTLCHLITEEVNGIETQEHSFHVDISQGYILHKFIELLGKFLQVPNIRVRFMKDGLLSQVLEALLVVRGLVVQKTKLIGDCGRLLRDLLDGLLEESFENKRHFIRACIAGLQTHRKLRNDRTLVFILELLCNIICPTKPEPAYMMVLNKAHTQEEFIRGSMTKNPYSSLEVGPLLRDVKNKICNQLDLLGLIEDDYGMELLVAGHIISLDLSVAQVYEQVWKKSQSQQSGTGTASGGSLVATSGRECPPMTITYRLQGLDGEATEPMIKELEDDREESQDPEVEFSIAGVMRECGGLETVQNMVMALTDDEIRSSQEELGLLLKLLMYCCKIRDNRLALLNLAALGILIDTARRAFAVEATEQAERLLLIVECLVTEANESDIGMAKSSLGALNLTEGDRSQAAYVVQMFLERLSNAHGAINFSKQQRNNDMVARILPYLTYGEQAAMELLVNYFDPYLHDWSSFDRLVRGHNDNLSDGDLPKQASQHQSALEIFCKVTESIKHDAQGEKLKGIIMQKGIISACIQHLKTAFAVFETAGDYRASLDWTRGLELPSIPIILTILKGLSSGHFSTQKALKEGGTLPLLHALEGVLGENDIGVRAENLMDTLADKHGKGEGFLSEEVMKLRHATREEMRKRALQKREELLQGLGMSVTSGGEHIVICPPTIEGLDDVQEEEAGLACMVCREGYSLCPTDMLGTYCFSKRVNLGIGANNNTRAEWVYTTVSHFNVIHFQCHLEAKRADASLKNPKKEWEGAALRNNVTLCNNLFPLRGPSVPLSQYARCVDQYWDNLNALGRADGSRLRLLIYDIVLMLARFATGASFSTDCKGGGKESNSRLLPFMLQMACHLLDQGGVSQKRLQSKALITYLSTPSQDIPPSGFKSSAGSGPQRLGAVDETVQFMMVQAILVQSLADWQQHRRLFLQRGVYHAYMQFKHGHASLAASSVTPAIPSSGESLNSSTLSKPTEDNFQSAALGDEQLFPVVQPMLIYTGLVDQLQCYLKSGPLKAHSGESAQEEHSKGEGASVHGTLEAWEVIMKERLRDIKAMLGFSNKLLEWLDEMQSAENLQEAFDVMGALADALASHSSCEDFIKDAINT